MLLLPLLLAGCRELKQDFKPATGKFAPPTITNAVPLTTVQFTNRINPAWLQPPTELFTLGPGDRLEIELMGEPASRSTTIVAPDGKIYFSLLPGVDVWGLTLTQAKAALERELAQYVRQPPQVSLVLREVVSKQVWILGRVQAPGVYPLSAPMTLLEAVSLAGGTMSMSSFRQQDTSGATDDLADLRRSFVLRQGKMLPVDFQRLLHEGDLSQNIYLQPDDFVYFPAATAREVYVLGAVAQPRPVPYREGMTAAQAVAGAYGTITGAYLEHVTVVRGSLTQPQIATLNYRKVIHGETPDIPLQPNDIVYVPFSPYRYLWRYVQLAINTFVTSAAINAGAKVTGTPVGGTGVFIPAGAAAPAAPTISPPPVK